MKAINSADISTLTEQPCLILLPFDFWKKIIPNSVLQLGCPGVHIDGCWRSCCCRVVSCSRRWMAATRVWRSPVATSECHAKLCGNIRWFSRKFRINFFPMILSLRPSRWWQHVTQSQTSARWVGLFWADQWPAGSESLLWVIYSLA